MREHTFLLEDISPLQVYGVNNLRLQQIEKGFPEVKVIARGEELKLASANQAKVEQLVSILDAILAVIRKKGNISQNKFDEMLANGSEERF